MAGTQALSTVPVVTVTGNTRAISSALDRGACGPEPSPGADSCGPGPGCPSLGLLPCREASHLPYWLQRKQLKGVSLEQSECHCRGWHRRTNAAGRVGLRGYNRLQHLLGVSPRHSAALEPAVFPPWRLRAAHWVCGEPGAPGPEAPRSPTGQPEAQILTVLTLRPPSVFTLYSELVPLILSGVPG